METDFTLSESKSKEKDPKRKKLKRCESQKGKVTTYFFSKSKQHFCVIFCHLSNAIQHGII